MFNIKKESKVFVPCPAKIVTGGAELLHQLVDRLNNLGLDSYIVYSEINASIPLEYQHYNIKVAPQIADDKNNIVVLYEGIISKAFGVKNAQLLLWWLSVDNFFYCSIEFLSIADYFAWKPTFIIDVLNFRLRNLIFENKNYFTNNKSISDIKKLNAINCYQSEYAKCFLVGHRFNKVFPLKDYINTDFYQESKLIQKENVVLYNPKKGLEFTKKLIKLSPDLKWKPLIGLSRKELTEVLLRSKLYVDFGNHPGKDRIPREAAISGCCIITGTRGSAKYYQDIPIPEEYKLDEKKYSKARIVKKIRDVLNNYSTHYENLEFYRKSILEEKTEFDSQVKSLFGL